MAFGCTNRDGPGSNGVDNMPRKNSTAVKNSSSPTEQPHVSELQCIGEESQVSEGLRVSKQLRISEGEHAGGDPKQTKQDKGKDFVIAATMFTV